MEEAVFYLAAVVLLQTVSECSGLEWEFGSNLSGSKTILEKDGIIPSYLQEKRVHIGKPKCTDVVYVKVEVEDMPTVTYNLDTYLVLIKFEKDRRRTKNTEFRVSAKGVKSEGPKCGSTSPKPTGYPEGDNPYIDGTPYFQFSNEYYQPRDATPNNVFPNDAHANEFSNDAHPYNEFPKDTHPHNEFPNDAHSNNEFPNDAHSNNEFPNDAHSNNEFPNDAHSNNEFPNDAHRNDAFPNDAHRNDAFPNDAHPDEMHHTMHDDDI